MNKLKRRRRWTAEKKLKIVLEALLADRLMVLGVVESISDETVRRTLKKTS